MKTILLFTIVLFVQNIGFAQQEKYLDSKEEVRQKCLEVVQNFGQDSPELAFSEIEKLWTLKTLEFSTFKEKLQTDMPKIADSFGKPIGGFIVKEECMENLLYRVSTAIKHETYGMRMVFTFYKGKADKWYLSNVLWDDKLSLLLIAE